MFGRGEGDSDSRILRMEIAEKDAIIQAYRHDIQTWQFWVHCKAVKIKPMSWNILFDGLTITREKLFLPTAYPIPIYVWWDQTSLSLSLFFIVFFVAAFHCCWLLLMHGCSSWASGGWEDVFVLFFHCIPYIYLIYCYVWCHCPPTQGRGWSISSKAERHGATRKYHAHTRYLFRCSPSHSITMNMILNLDLNVMT